LKNLQSPTISIPFEVLFEEDPGQEDALTIRFMKPEDMKFVLPMCIAEFGSGPTARIADFPWQDLRKVSDWWDQLYFEPSIALALRVKMNANLHQPMHDFEDSALLVLCRRQSKEDPTEIVVGMVELSLQPPEVNRNPPSYPVPRWIKEEYCQLTGQTAQGWVTNLLIDPDYRGLGYSKILMAATEGIARAWGRDSIYLHADADIRGGRVPQALYEGLGYEVVTDDNPQYSWMGDGFNPFSSIRMIEGVPLLCFCKRL
jgi:ribosomal protein S18 acetylase RimI-like enzyme